MRTVQERLELLKSKYHLSVSDIALMMGCNRSTVWSWLRGVTPSATRMEQIEERISAVQRAGKFFPVPLNITQYQRKSYLMDAVNGRAARVRKSGTATGE